MTISDVKDAVSRIKNGAFVSVEYETFPTVSASYKKIGIVVTKRTKKVARIGVNYYKIAQVIAKQFASPCKNENSPRINPYEWEIKNVLAKNIHSNDRYVQIANVPNHSNTKSRWFLNGEEVGFEEVKGYVTPSYLNKSDTPTIQKINIDNIIRIG